MLFIFLGSRDPRLRNAVEAVLGHPAPDDLAYTHLDGARVGPDELNAACGAVSMFGDRRRVFLDGAPPSGPPARRLIKWLAAFGDAQAKNTNTDTCDLAVSVYLDLGDRRTAPRVKAFNGLTQHGARVQQFGPLHDAEAVRFVRSLARREGVGMSEDAAARLVELITADAGLLTSEVEKLATYVGFNGEITERDVNAACATIGEHARWDYVNALTDRRGAAALSVLHDMLALRTPHEMILGRYHPFAAPTGGGASGRGRRRRLPAGGAGRRRAARPRSFPCAAGAAHARPPDRPHVCRSRPHRRGAQINRRRQRRAAGNPDGAAGHPACRRSRLGGFRRP